MVKVYHVHLKGYGRKALKGEWLEGKHLWYSPTPDDGFQLHWKEIGNDGRGYISYEITINDHDVTDNIDDADGRKILKLTKANARKFARRYVSGAAHTNTALLKDFAGVDATDASLMGTVAYAVVNNSPASGAIWRFKHLDLSVKVLESYSP